MIGNKLRIINGSGGWAFEPVNKLIKSGRVHAECKMASINAAAFNDPNSFKLRAKMVAAK